LRKEVRLWEVRVKEEKEGRRRRGEIKRRKKGDI
jgi:hypothetical protein